ncbi:helix-turn-helix domain-containing protein [Streptomyces sp. NPDC001922]|uniref:helix-turn-helix domain-containing protein n=1 Tax=Streptomyces sp. NPDC001922 TaxID=3364624 RepID=UPI0036954AC7
MGHPGESSPFEVQDAAGFVLLMRQLKDRSGLTYRELEERATRNGDVLARSTLADILRRTSLPRPDVLAAFVRACGDGQRAGDWLEARNRIAAESAAEPVTAPGPEAGVPSQPPEHQRPPEPADSRSGRAKSRTVALATVLTVLLTALAAWVLLPDGSDAPGAPGAAATTPTGPATPRAPADGWVTIRPARTPDLCLTDGRDRNAAYPSAVAVQLRCARATVPRTYLEPAGEGLYRIQWHHPQLGKGCLTVMTAGPVRNMLEPRDKCARATLFRLEPTVTGGTAGFRLRPDHSSRCIGIVDNDITEGAEATQEPCTGAADQRFLVRAG